MDNYLFRTEDVSKNFGATKANQNISLNIKSGEVHGLIGENGSGKSTMISMIAGMQKMDSGKMFLHEKPYDPLTPLVAIEAKIGTVVQELGLVDGLSIAANIYLGRMDQFKKANIIDNTLLNNEAAHVFEKWSLPALNPRLLVGSLSVEQKKIVELARALSIEPDLLILDEITAALSHDSREGLFEVIQKLISQNKSVLLISHDLEEMLALTDRITVLRDGQKITTEECKSLNEGQLKQLMVGRELKDNLYREDISDNYSNEIALTIKNISDGLNFSDVSLDLHKGEIVGLCGLSDSGIHQVAEAVYGVRPLVSGEVTMTKGDVKITNASIANNSGMGYVPKDRDTQALMVDDTIEHNVAITMLNELSGRLGVIRPKKIHEAGKQVIDDYKVVATGSKAPLRSLSGGNRQKINLGRWLIQDKSVLIFDSPTRGVDVGVKSYIYDIIEQLKEDDVAVLLVSDELPEIIGLSDTVYVFKDGKIRECIKRSEGLTENKIIEVML